MVAEEKRGEAYLDYLMATLRQARYKQSEADIVIARVRSYPALEARVKELEEGLSGLIGWWDVSGAKVDEILRPILTAAREALNKEKP